MKKNLAYWGLGICTVLASGAIAAGLTPSLAPSNEYEYSLNPEDGATVKNLRQIEITFSDPDVKFVENTLPSAVVLENTSTGESYLLKDADLDTFAPEGTNTWHLNFVAEGSTTVTDITTTGDYTLKIAEGAFAETVEGVVNGVQEITAHYTIGFPYTISAREEGDLSSLEITFTNENVEFYEENNTPAVITLVNKTTGEAYEVAGVDKNTRAAKGSSWFINLRPEGEENVTEIVQPGDYELYVKEGAFVVFGEDGAVAEQVPAITWNTKIAGFNYAIQPFVGHDQSSLWINFPTEGITFDPNYESNSIVLENETTGAVYYLSEIVEYTRTPIPAGSNWLINLRPEGEEIVAPITAPGNYKLHINEGVFNAGSEKVQAINWKNNVAGQIFTMEPYAEGNLKQILVHFANDGVEYNQDSFNKNQAYLVNMTTGASYLLAGVDKATRVAKEGSNWIFTMIPEGGNEVVDITAGGDYQLTVLKGAFKLDGNDVDQLNWSYGILNQEHTVVPVVEGDFSQLWINFSNEAIAYFENNNMPNAITLVNNTTGETYTCAGVDNYTRATKAGSNWIMNFVAEGEDNMTPITVPGDYTLTIAEGAFATLDAQGAPVAKVNQIVENLSIEGVAYTIKPRQEGDLSSLDVHFFAEGIEYFEDNRMPNAVVLENTVTGETYVLAGCDKNTRSMEGGSNWILNFMPEDGTQVVAITAPGNYKLSIIEGAFNQTDENGATTDPVQAINWEYTIAGYPYTISLENEGNMGVINLSFINSNISFNSDAHIVNYAILKNETTGNEYIAAEPDVLTRMGDGSNFALHFIPDGMEEAVVINEPGVYTLYIKEGSFVDGTEKVQAISWQHEMKGYDYTIWPTEEDNLKSIEIHFDVEGIDYFQNNNQPNNIVLTNETTGVEYYLAGCDKNTRSERGGSNWTMHFIQNGEDQLADITAPGLYTLTISDGSFVIFAEDGTVGQKVQQITWFKNIEGYNYTVQPYVAGDLGTLWVNFDAEGVEYFPGREYTNIVLTNNTTGEDYACIGVDQYTKAAKDGSNLLLRFSKDGEELAQITEAGTYTLYCAKGAFVVMDGEEIETSSQTMYWTYTINNFAYDIIPQDEENLMNIDIHFENANVEYYADNNMPNAIVLENTTTGDVYYGDATMNTRSDLGGSNWTMTFIPDGAEDAVAITAPGSYKLTILEGAFVVKDQLGDVATKVQTINWETKIAGYAWSIQPYESENLKTLVINFTDENVEYFENNRLPEAVVLTNTTTGMQYDLAGVDRYTKSAQGGVSYLITLKPVDADDAQNIFVPGKYTLTIKKGVFAVLDEQGLPEEEVQTINWEYNLLGFSYTISLPDESNLKTIDIRFDNSDIRFNDDSYDTLVQPVILENSSTGAVYNLAGADLNDRNMNGGAEFAMNFAPENEWDVVDITEEGIYKLYIKKGAFVVLGDDENGNEVVVDDVQPIEWIYVLVGTGIENVPGFDNNTVYNVFSVNGTVVLRNGSSDDVNNLEKGLYIINGKRVMIR